MLRVQVLSISATFRSRTPAYVDNTGKRTTLGLQSKGNVHWEGVSSCRLHPLPKDNTRTTLSANDRSQQITELPSRQPDVRIKVGQIWRGDLKALLSAPSIRVSKTFPKFSQLVSTGNLLASSKDGQRRSLVSPPPPSVHSRFSSIYLSLHRIERRTRTLMINETRVYVLQATM
jgi:hypothetical protein